MTGRGLEGFMMKNGRGGGLSGFVVGYPRILLRKMRGFFRASQNRRNNGQRLFGL
jgi:hypothetical protein